MQIDERREGATLVLALQGRLDGQSAPALQTRLLEGIDGGERTLLLDCSALEYISSIGLRALLSASKRLNERDGRLLLCAPSAPIAEVLRVSGFDTILEIHPDADAALAALRAR